MASAPPSPQLPKRARCGPCDRVHCQGVGDSLNQPSAARPARSGFVFGLLADRYLNIETALVVRIDQRMGILQGFINELLFQLRTLKLDIQ
jgi:hypothetical protein